MTRDLETLEARELDARVAELVMGYVWKICLGYDFPLLYRPDAEVDPDDWGFFDLIDDPHPDVPHYSTTWNGFGAVFTRLRELDIGMVAGGPPNYPPTVSLFCLNRNHGNVQGLDTFKYEWPDMPRAICVAAIRVIEGSKL